MTSTSGAVAALDLGTNSTRLLILDAHGRTLAREMEVTRLGAGVDANRLLAADSIERTVACLRNYRILLDRHGVSSASVRAAATSAARDAINRDELFDAVAETIGVRPELLSGDEEGRLAFAGATNGVAPKEANGFDLVLDIGGGSTEFIVGRPGEDPVGVWSADIGCIRVTEQWLHHNPPTAEELSQAISVVHSHLDDVEREVPAVHDATRLIGVAGSITTVAAVEIGLPVYDRDRTHGFALTRAAAEDVFRTLATEKRADRAHNPGLPAARIDSIVGGSLVLVTVMRHLGFENCLVSETDILDGIAAQLLNR